MSAKSAGSSGMVKVAVTLERPPSDELQHMSRAEKHRALRENSARLRQHLISWLDERGMAGEVARVGEPTIFNTLFVVATRRVAEQLRRAPGVTSVGPEDAVAVDIPRPARRSVRLR
ncbi:MAG TPA: hypothetical protein VNL77_14020 [Roseiflexaceae bacterium]|nr:hypothetical protein [Roseiflexaceae bacterium]